ncbi:hypothetical protein F5X99DRAFT_387400 [Biscogniauxia marginata]|nr:hypothetical protein F5X99DRAFT_387400 [Biscogniauxia marginata]
MDRLIYGSQADVVSVVLGDGRKYQAEKTILVTGAWSSHLVNLDDVITANAVGIAYIKLTERDMVGYQDMGSHIHLGQGINTLTPI